MKKDKNRNILVKVGPKFCLVTAEKVKDYDSAKKFEIVKYAKGRVALVKAGTPHVVLQDCFYISKVKNGMAKYYNLQGDWGILNERAQVTCEAGTLKAQRKKEK